MQKLLTSVDRSNPLGRRDYAILIMAAKLGLRVSDIINLTFDEIDWTKKTLSITQQKTGKLVELPLTEDVGWAIIDYLQHGRPESECIHVFIKHCAPYDGLNSNISKRLQKYQEVADIDVCPRYFERIGSIAVKSTSLEAHWLRRWHTKV